MAKRKALSKKIRFEVFKRDKFTCQYCGRKAPDIVLEVDHIDPVAGGGGNEIVNLITSCFDCNNGKRDKRLDDNSVVEKQRKQLELLQERREQIELMLEWKKSLATFDEDVVDMIVDYIESKIPGYQVNEHGRQKVAPWVKKFGTDRILDGIDESANKYLKYEKNALTKDSVELFLDKIAGVIVVKGMPPIKQKLAYIKGIARNRFNYWDDKRGSIILNNYIEALEEYGWDEARILDDLENEVKPRTIEANNWTQWKSLLEGWIADIAKWEKPATFNVIGDTCNAEHEVSQESLEASARYTQNFASHKIDALVHIGKAFPGFSELEFKNSIECSIFEFLKLLDNYYRLASTGEIDAISFNFVEFIENQGLLKYFNPGSDTDNYGMLDILLQASQSLLIETITGYDLSRTLYLRRDAEVILRQHLERFEIICESV